MSEAGRDARGAGVSLFRSRVQGEVTVDEYVEDVKRRVAISMEVRQAMRRHRRRKPISFLPKRRP